MDPFNVAYIVSRFPKISETFILLEMVELEKQGATPVLYSLVKENETILHPEAEKYLSAGRFGRSNRGEIFRAQLYWISKAPLKYFSTWGKALVGNITSPKFFLRALITMPTAAWFACKMIDDQIDHIHAHWATHSTLAAWVVNRLTGLPYSFTAHANDIYVDQTMLAEKIDQADHVVTISRYNQTFLEKISSSAESNHITVIPCGVDTQFFQPKIHTIQTEKPFTISCVGRLVDKKGQRFLIEACHKLKTNGIDFHCRFIGDGPNRDTLSELVDTLGLDNNVSFLGTKTRSEVASLLDESDVMVLPSITTPSGRMEGIPVVLMEAMAVELPVISTNISGIPELIQNEENGLLVPEKNSDSLAIALEKIYDNPDWAAKIGKKGRDTVLNRFDLVKNTARLFDLFKESAGQPTALPIKAL